MRRLRYPILLLITLILAGGIIASLINNQRSAEMAATRIQLSAWSLAQLEQEFIKFHTSLRLFQTGVIPISRLHLDYDLLWNRLEVFLTGAENQAIRQRFGAESTARKLFAQLKQDETLLYSSTLQPGPQLEAAIERYGLYQRPIRSLSCLPANFGNQK